MSNNTVGYVAVDDVQLIIGDCPTTQFCDFENADICGYKDDLTAKFKWKRNKGPQVMGNTGNYLFLK